MTTGKALDGKSYAGNPHTVQKGLAMGRRQVVVGAFSASMIAVAMKDLIG